MSTTGSNDQGGKSFHIVNEAVFNSAKLVGLGVYPNSVPSLYPIRDDPLVYPAGGFAVILYVIIAV